MSFRSSTTVHGNKKVEANHDPLRGRSRIWPNQELVALHIELQQVFNTEAINNNPLVHQEPQRCTKNTSINDQTSEDLKGRPRMTQAPPALYFHSASWYTARFRIFWEWLLTVFGLRHVGFYPMRGFPSVACLLGFCCPCLSSLGLSVILQPLVAYSCGSLISFMTYQSFLSLPFTFIFLQWWMGTAEGFSDLSRLIPKWSCHHFSSVRCLLSQREFPCLWPVSSWLGPGPADNYEAYAI